MSASVVTAGRGVADRLGELIRTILDVDQPPLRLACWDGSQVGPTDAPCLVLRSKRALQRLMWAPDQVGLGRAYVAGDLDLDGDIFDALHRLGDVAALEKTAREQARRHRAQLVKLAMTLGLVGANPPPPPEEVAALDGARHSPDRDRQAIEHHYDVGNEFYRLVLGPSMTYSCAVWESPSVGLEAAQDAKHDLVCRKLGLDAGGPARLLDVGCGWGSMVLHAARHYGVRAVGVTLAQRQADHARRRIADAGLSDRVEIRVQDYRSIDDGPYDAISSIGMAEHVGKDQMPVYARCLHRLLRPKGRLLNHAIALGRPDTGQAGDTFISRYVFPDGELLTVDETAAALAAGGFEIRDVESLREHYALTLRAWVANLQKHWDQAVALTSQGRARVWLLYMAGSALAFEAGRIGVNQVLCVRPDDAGGAGFPLRRSW